MILSPQSLSRQRLVNSHTDILSARLNTLPQLHLLCEIHKEPPQHICLHDPCTKQLLCPSCIPLHSQSHKSCITSYQEIVRLDIVKKIDHEITQNLLVEQRNEICLKYLEQVQVSFGEIRKRIEKTLSAILASLKEKALSYCIEPVFPTAEWEKLKKALLEKKIVLTKSDPDTQHKSLDEFLHVFMIAIRMLGDAELAGSPMDLKDPIDLPEIEQEYVDEAIKTMRGVLNNFSASISMPATSLNSPEDNIRRTQNIIPSGNNPNLTSRINTYRRMPTNTSSAQSSNPPPISNNHRIFDNAALASRLNDLMKHKSLIPEESTLPRLPPFIYDEYLETETIDLPYCGPLKMDEENLYRGQMKNEKRHGKGKQTWKDGRVYEGYFKNDHIEGKGRMIHADHDVYEGYWVNGKAHGKGKYVKPDGWIYEGDWLNDQPHGKGIETWPDGSTYEGEFEKGVKSGKGTLIGPDGSCYSGGFKDNVFHGEGKYIWIDGRKYEGRWVNNVREGKGVMTWPDGKKYDGEFVDDKREGFGRYDWGDGRKYIGYWKDGKQHGQGKLQNKSGKLIEGEWKEGKLLTDMTSALAPTGRNSINMDTKSAELLRISKIEGRKSQFSGVEVKSPAYPQAQSPQPDSPRELREASAEATYHHKSKEQEDIFLRNSLMKTEDPQDKVTA